MDRAPGKAECVILGLSLLCDLGLIDFLHLSFLLGQKGMEMHSSQVALRM